MSDAFQLRQWAYIESLRLPGIPSQRLHVRAEHGTYPRIRRSRIEHTNRSIIATRKQHSRLLLVPLHRLHLVLVHVETPYRNRAFATPIRIRCRRTTEIPQLDRPICRCRRQHVSVRSIP